MRLLLTIKGWQDRLVQRDAEQINDRLRALQAAAARLASAEKPTKEQLEDYARRGEGIFVS